jgi:DNA-binding MarR family transcriptional regulator
MADWLGVTSATVTGIANKLAAQHLIKRWREEEDRRVVRIDVTEAGEELLTKKESMRREKIADLVSSLSVEDLKALTDILGRVTQQIVGS